MLGKEHDNPDPRQATIHRSGSSQNEGTGTNKNSLCLPDTLKNRVFDEIITDSLGPKIHLLKADDAKGKLNFAATQALCVHDYEHNSVGCGKTNRVFLTDKSSEERALTFNGFPAH